jgi:ubiquinone biosynthesis protein UbiJ
MEIDCSEPTMIGYIHVEDQKMRFVSGAAESPHVVIKGSAANILRWLRETETEDLIIDGDHNTLLSFLDLAQSFDPDIEHTLTELLGPSVAGRAAGTAELGLRGLHSLIQGVGQSLKGKAAETFVEKDEFDSLLGGLDELRLRVDRLSANLRERERGS